MRGESAGWIKGSHENRVFVSLHNRLKYHTIIFCFIKIRLTMLQLLYVTSKKKASSRMIVVGVGLRQDKEEQIF